MSPRIGDINSTSFRIDSDTVFQGPRPSEQLFAEQRRAVVVDRYFESRNRRWFGQGPIPNSWSCVSFRLRWRFEESVTAAPLAVVARTPDGRDRGRSAPESALLRVGRSQNGSCVGPPERGGSRRLFVHALLPYEPRHGPSAVMYRSKIARHQL